MSDGTYDIWCLLEGENTPFSVAVLPTISIDKLKNLIKEKALIHAAAHRLTLWKVRITSDLVMTSRVTIDPMNGLCWFAG